MKWIWEIPVNIVCVTIPGGTMKLGPRNAAISRKDSKRFGLLFRDDHVYENSQRNVGSSQMSMLP